MDQVFGATAARRLPRWARALVALVVFAAAATVLRVELRGVAWAEVGGALSRIPAASIGLALLAVAGTLVGAAAYDALSLAALGHRADLRGNALVSSVAYALAHAGALGLSAATALRLAAYRSRGLHAADVVRVSAMSAVTSVLGGVCLAAFAVLSPVLEASHLPQGPAVLLGTAALAGLALYLGLPRRGPVGRRLPPRGVAALQLAASLAEWAAAASVLYVMLPADTRGSWLAVLPVYGLAGTVGGLSGLPGGVGVFDAVILAVLGERVGAGGVTAGLLAYRLVYSVGLVVVGAMLLTLRSSGLRDVFRRP